MRGTVHVDQRPMAAIEPSLHALGKAVRRIEVGAAATQPTQKNFLANVPSLKSVSAPSPLSPPIPKFLIARYRRDDLDLGGGSLNRPRLRPQRRAS